jgi:hypothetical protein
MTQHRMLANASFRVSETKVTHDVSGRSPSDVRACQECPIGPMRPAKLHENESEPLRVFNGLSHVFDPAESAFDRSVTGKNNVVLDADNEPM